MTKPELEPRGRIAELTIPFTWIEHLVLFSNGKETIIMSNKILGYAIRWRKNDVLKYMKPAVFGGDTGTYTDDLKKAALFSTPINALARLYDCGTIVGAAGNGKYYSIVRVVETEVPAPVVPPTWIVKIGDQYVIQNAMSWLYGLIATTVGSRDQATEFDSVKAALQAVTTIGTSSDASRIFERSVQLTRIVPAPGNPTTALSIEEIS